MVWAEKNSTRIKDDQRRELYKESKHIEKVASVMFRHINIDVRSFMEEIRTRLVFKWGKILSQTAFVKVNNWNLNVYGQIHY